MVDGVGDHDVVPSPFRDLAREQRQALRFAELRPVRRPVRESPVAGADAAHDCLEVVGQLHEAVVTGVADEDRPRQQSDDLAGKAQRGRLGPGRNVRRIALAQRSLGGVLGDQLVEQGPQRVCVTFAGELRGNVTLGVDKRQGRPGPHGVGLPGREVRVVEDWMPHVVALDGGADGPVVRLVRELRRVDAYHRQDVGVLLFDGPQLVEHVQTVHAAERPEVQQDETSAQRTQRQALVPGVEPATSAVQLGCPHASASRLKGGHGSSQPRGSTVASRSRWRTCSSAATSQAMSMSSARTCRERLVRRSPEATVAIPRSPTASVPVPTIVGATATISRSATPAASMAVITRAPPSTSSDRTPLTRRSFNTASRSTPLGPVGTVRTATWRDRSSSRRSGLAWSVAKMIVVASSSRTRAVGGVRRVESRTTRTGDAPATMRTVSCGSSVTTVPTPTSTASHAARKAWEMARSPSPLIHFESPLAVAIRPSSVCAYFRTTCGRSECSRMAPRSSVTSATGSSQPFSGAVAA